MNGEVHFDYTAVGHVTADVMADGSRRAGGSAFYSALQAARLGQRVLIITQGAPGEIEELLDPYRSELELEIRPARRTTTLETPASGGGRTQRILAWAGPIAGDVTIDTSILHLAPVARETPSRWQGRADFVGLTPQGLVRSWPAEGERPAVGQWPADGAEGEWPAGGAEITQVPLAPSLLPERCDAIVISENERESCAWLTSGAGGAGSVQAAGTGEDRRFAAAAGAVVAVTAEAAPTTIHLPGGAIAHVEVPAIEHFRDDVGAGDVFAAAFFVALREGRSPQAAASFANAAAAVRIVGAGAVAIGDRSAIEARLHAVAAT